MKIDLIARALSAWRAGKVGDAAAFKAAAISAPAYPDVERQMRMLDVPFPPINLGLLRGMAPDSFGHTYAAHMDARALTPLVISPDVAAELASFNVLAVRYPILHDAFHVLLGFDTDLPGELGVWTFVSAQHYSPSFDRAAAFARVLYPLAAPRQWQALHAARHRALRMAGNAACLIVQPLEEYWSQPLAVVRERFGIEAKA